MTASRSGRLRPLGSWILVVFPAVLLNLIFMHPYALTRGRAPAGSDAKNFRVCWHYPNCAEEPIPENEYEPYRIQTCGIHPGVPRSKLMHGYKRP